jgi:hypothetical protein
MARKELRRAQRSKKHSKSTQKLKRARKTQKLHKSSKSTLPLKSTPPLAMNSSNTNQEKNEMFCMRINIRVLHKAYKHVFEQLYPSPYQNLQNKSKST